MNISTADIVRRILRPGHRPAGAEQGPRPRCAGGPKHRERGMVTAELAVSILAATLIAAGLCWVIGVIGTQIRCQDSAAAIARQLARGDENGVERARASVPAGGGVRIDTAGDVVRVTVTDELSWGRLGPVPVSGSATVTKEPRVMERRP